MTRRGFIKWLLAGLAIMAGVVGALFKLGVNDGGQTAGSGGTEGSPSGQGQPPLPEPTPTPFAGDGLPLLSFFVLSDVHVNADIKEPTDHLRWALDDISQFESPVDAIVFGGDLTDYGRDSDYRELRRILDGYTLPPLYANMGNHDYYHIWLDGNGQFSAKTVPNGKTDAGSREKFQAFMGQDQVYRDVWMNGVHLIMLSQETYVQEKPEVREGAWYSDAQLEWLRRKMAEHRDGRPVMVMIHQGLPAIGQDGGNHNLIRANAFRDILKPYPNTFVFSGHGHRDFHYTEDHYIQESFHWFVNSSVGRVLNRRYQQEHPNYAQGMYVQVYADKVVLRGREFSDRTWVPGAEWTVPLVSVKV